MMIELKVLALHELLRVRKPFQIVAAKSLAQSAYFA